MKLEIGKFIRTPYGIRKIVNITKDDGYGKPKVRVIELDRHLNTPYKFDYIFYTDENVIKKCKTSYDIIDILEVGDAIEIDVIDKDNYPTIMGINFARIDNKVELASIKDMLKNESAKLLTVITREQMEQIAYKVGE